MIDIDKIRAETPSCADVLHFNNAGASLMPLPVYTALTQHLQREFEIGGYEAERLAEPELRAFYTEFAGLLNATPQEIAYVENATRAWDMAFYSLPLEPGDRVLTHGSEYVSNFLGLLQQARRRGIEVDLVPSDATGQIDPGAIEAMITPRTRVVALTHVPTQGGLVNPAAEIGRIARRHGLTYLLDACQSVGQMVVDVEQIGCDMLSGTGRKFLRGPRGTGFLYVRRALLDRVEPPFIDLRAADWTGPDSYALAPDARRFETWESNVAGRIGLMAAVRYARGVGLGAIERRVTALAADLRAQLAELPGVTLHDLGSRKCGIVTFLKRGLDPGDLAAGLGARAINISVSSAGSARLDLDARGLTSLARASVHYFNTEEEVSRFVAAVAAAPSS